MDGSLLSYPYFNQFLFNRNMIERKLYALEAREEINFLESNRAVVSRSSIEHEN